MRHGVLLLVLATGCGGPAPAATATKAPPKCAEYLGAGLELRPKPDALLTWMVMEGAPGYEYEFLLQIDRASTLSFVDIRWSEPGPNGLADRTKAPGKCFSRKVGAEELAKLEAALDEHHLCAQKVERPDPDDAPHRLEVHLGKVDCKVSLDGSEQDMTPDGLASYKALAPLISER